MTRYDVTVKGCDDTTRLFGVPLDDTEAALMRRVVDEVNERSEGGCQPTIEFTPSPAPPATGTCGRCYEDITPGQDLERDRYGDWRHTTCKEPWA
jgi:hypothetical protein